MQWGSQAILHGLDIQSIRSISKADTWLYRELWPHHCASRAGDFLMARSVVGSVPNGLPRGQQRCFRHLRLTTHFKCPQIKWLHGILCPCLVRARGLASHQHPVTVLGLRLRHFTVLPTGRDTSTHTAPCNVSVWQDQHAPQQIKKISKSMWPSLGLVSLHTRPLNAARQKLHRQRY